MTTTPRTDLPYNPAVFRLYRQRRGWTQAQLGERIERSAAWVSRLESGKSRPTFDDLDVFAKAVGIKKTTLARQAFETTPESD